MSTLDWLLDHIGDPYPCGFCGAMTNGEESTEGVIPRKTVSVVDGCQITVDEVVRLCPACAPFSRSEAQNAAT